MVLSWNRSSLFSLLRPSNSISAKKQKMRIQRRKQLKLQQFYFCFKHHLDILNQSQNKGDLPYFHSKRENKNYSMRNQLYMVLYRIPKHIEIVYLLLFYGFIKSALNLFFQCLKKFEISLIIFKILATLPAKSELHL